MCRQCGAIYSTDGNLVAAGAVATDAEHHLDLYRKDMAHLRNAFAGVMIAAGGLAAWLGLGPGPETLQMGQVILIGGLGATASVPFVYFAHKSIRARRDLKALRQARRAGHIPPAPRD
jgi:hypothetical protein